MNFITATTSPLIPFLSSLHQSQLLLIIALLVAFVWIVYTIILLYHWFHYSYKSRYAAVVFAVHVFISVLLGLFAVSGFYL